MSPRSLSRPRWARTVLVAASAMALLVACEDDDSPTGPVVADFPEMDRATPPEAVGAAAALAANGKIAFRSDRIHFSNWEIFVMNADGSGQRRITNYASADREPAWSPDGTKLAFTREVNGIQPDIFLMTPGATDTTIVNLTNTGTTWDWEAAWKPDGSRLAFTRLNGSNQGVYAMSAANGSGQTRLTSPAGYEFMAAWSPDGSKLAVTCRADGTTASSKDICVMNADGSNPVTLIAGSGWEEYDPAWSPDGSQIAFTRSPTGTNNDHDVYVMNADGTNVRRLTGGPNVPAAWDHEPVWSPDGTKIAFTTNRTGNYEIFVMNPDGSGQTNLTNSPGNDNQPSWQALASNPPPPPPVNQAPNGSITAPASNVTIQVGQSVSFAGSGTDADGTIAGYAWSLQGGSPSSSTAQNPGAVTYAAAGTYTAALTVTDDKGASDATPATRTITVVATPQNQAPDGAITAPAANVTIQAGQTVTFAGSGSDPDGTIAGWTWTFPGGSPASSNAQNPGAVTFASAGTYTVTLAVTDNGGAADATPATRTITVQGVTPPPTGPTVGVTSTAFTPGTTTGAQGGAVQWAFHGPGTHDVTDKSGMGLFASGSKAPGATYTFAFQGAGTYTYHCSLHRTTHSGKIRVPVQVSPASGTRATTFTVTWASAAAPSGYVYDIQIKRPGTTGFVNWKVGQTARSASFTADRGTGTYSFRARLKKLGNGRTSQYSPVKAISVR